MSREKIIIFILAIPLLVLSFFLVSFGGGMFAIGASDGGGYKSNTENTETIYESRQCADGVCKDSGKKLIEFKGGDAECENYKTEQDRMTCYSQNSQASFACADLEDSGEVNDCYEKNGAVSFDQNQGGAGTLVVSNSITVNGSRMYMNGFDCNGEHHVETGTNKGSNVAMTFRDGSRDVQYGGDVSAGGNGMVVLSEEGGVYFGSEVEYGETDLNEDGLRGQGITEYNNFNGMNLNGCNDMKVLANHHNLITIPSTREAFGGVEIEKGLEVNGDLKTDFMYFQGRFLKWSEPIRGHFILYYNTDPEEGDGCTEPDSPRDTAPNSTPDLDGAEEDSTGGGSSSASGGGSSGGGSSSGGGGNSSGSQQFIWKDSDVSGRGAVVVLPASYPDDCTVSVNGGSSSSMHGRANGDRPTFYFSQSTSDYGADASVVATCSDGTTGSWTVTGPRWTQ